MLVDATGWRLVFFVNLAFGLAALVPARRLLRETREPDPGPLPDALGVGLLIAGVALVSLGIVKGEDWGWGGPAVLGSLAAGVVLVALCALRSARHPAPVVELSLFRVRSFAVASGGRRAVRARLLRAPAGQRAVPDAGLGLVDPRPPASR